MILTICWQQTSNDIENVGICRYCIGYRLWDIWNNSLLLSLKMSLFYLRVDAAVATAVSPPLIASDNIARAICPAFIVASVSARRIGLMPSLLLPIPWLSDRERAPLNMCDCLRPLWSIASNHHCGKTVATETTDKEGRIIGDDWCWRMDGVLLLLATYDKQYPPPRATTVYVPIENDRILVPMLTAKPLFAFWRESKTIAP